MPDLLIEASPRGCQRLDLALFGEIEDLLASGRAATPAEAALMLVLAGRVWGHGKPENRARRLVRRFRDWQAMTRTERCRGIPRRGRGESAMAGGMRSRSTQAPASAADLAALEARVAALEARVAAAVIPEDSP